MDHFLFLEILSSLLYFWARLDFLQPHWSLFLLFTCISSFPQTLRSALNTTTSLVTLLFLSLPLSNPSVNPGDSSYKIYPKPDSSPPLATFLFKPPYSLLWIVAFISWLTFLLLFVSIYHLVLSQQPEKPC